MADTFESRALVLVNEIYQEFPIDLPKLAERFVKSPTDEIRQRMRRCEDIVFRCALLAIEMEMDSSPNYLDRETAKAAAILAETAKMNEENK